MLRTPDRLPMLNTVCMFSGFKLDTRGCGGLLCHLFCRAGFFFSASRYPLIASHTFLAWRKGFTFAIEMSYTARHNRIPKIVIHACDCTSIPVIDLSEFLHFWRLKLIKIRTLKKKAAIFRPRLPPPQSRPCGRMRLHHQLLAIAVWSPPPIPVRIPILPPRIHHLVEPAQPPTPHHVIVSSLCTFHN